MSVPEPLSARSLDGYWLGRRRYAPVLELQERLLARRQAGHGRDSVLFVEHEPVVTLGRGAHREHVLVADAALAERGIELCVTSRGGDVTLHAPGQLVAYPIVDLSPDRRDVRRWVRSLTEVMRRLTAELGIASGLHPKHVGLWADAGAPASFGSAEEASELVKLGAIGVRISRWVTMHGFALNLSPDLAQFSCIVPCGIREHGVGSIAALGGRSLSVEAAARRAFSHLADVLEMRAGSYADDPSSGFAQVEAAAQETNASLEAVVGV